MNMHVIHEVRDFASLLDGLRARIKDLDVTAESVEGTGGLTTGYLSKILKQHRAGVAKMRPFTMGILLQGLGVKLLMVQDDEQMERIKRRLTKRVSNRVPHVGVAVRTKAMRTKVRKKNPAWESHRGDSEWGRAMRLRAISQSTPAYLQRMMRRAAKARWRKRRRAKRPSSPA